MKVFWLNILTRKLYGPMLESEIHFQCPGSLIFDRLIDFHDFVLCFLLFILVIFLWFIFLAVNLYRFFFVLNSFYHFQKFTFAFLSALWTIKSQKIVMTNIENIFIFRKVKLHFFNYIYKFIDDHLPFDFNYYLTNLRKIIFTDYLINTKRKVHAPLLEIIWTIFPSFILIIIAIPSLYLLYILDAIEPLSFAVKVIGHQWYWTYEIGCLTEMFKMINNVTSVAFDSYMISDENSTLRLLEVDNVLFTPANVPLTFFITSTDVIHSWAIPSIGVKVDAIPGRLNQICTTLFDVGSHYGQCSELCGVNHGFMPINLISLVDTK